ncbi:MAG: substrate-binding domain-containing protein [Acidobacteriia bacterium]|nr:substrate-binding domain-containing protein [Terriglobia bacterium]
MARMRIVVSLPNDNAYQHEQGTAAKLAAERLGLDVQVLQADNDSIVQSQQLLEIIQSRSEPRPGAFLVEPVTAMGLRRVAEVAVAQGMAWVVSNSDVDYVKDLRKDPRVPVFMVSQGQQEIGQLQGQQLAALLPQGGSVLYIQGPSSSSVAVQRHEGMETTKPRNVQITTLRSKWSEEGACESAGAWLRLATSRAEKFHLVAGQTHELALGARKAFQSLDNREQQKRWLALPFLGIGIASQVKPLVNNHVLAAAVITSLTMELAMEMLVRAIEKRVQPPERSLVEASSYPDLAKLAARK